MNGFLTLLTTAVAFLILGILVLMVAGDVNQGGLLDMVKEAAAGSNETKVSSQAMPEPGKNSCPDNAPELSLKGNSPSMSVAPSGIGDSRGAPAPDALKAFKLPGGLRIEGTGETCK